MKTHQLVAKQAGNTADWLSIVANNLSDTVIYTKDRDSKFTLANTALAKILGAESAEDMIGKDDFDFFPQETAAK